MVTDPTPAERAGKSCQFKSHRLKHPRLERLLLSVSSVALVQAMLLSPSTAQTANWTGGGDGTTWSDGANWSTGTKPTNNARIHTSATVTLNTSEAIAGAFVLGSETANPDLNIVTGGRFGAGTPVSHVNIYVGSSAGTSTLTLTGPNAGIASGTGSIRIGEIGITTANPGVHSGTPGQGSLIVQGGATISGAQIYLADAVNSTASMFVDGAGTSVFVPANAQNTGWLSVGFAGRGSLEISNGATVSSQVGALATTGPGNGSALIYGQGSIWTIYGGTEFHVGGAGTGTLTLFSGGTLDAMTSEVVIGKSGHGTVSVGNNSLLTTQNSIVLGYEGSGNGTLTVSAGGTVTSGIIYITRPLQTNTTGTLNIGAAPGDPASAPGTINAPGIQFGDGNGTVNFNHNASNYIFSLPMTGPGAVNQIAGTTILTAVNGYTGPTNISGGTLQVDGAITASPVAVNAAGTLSGIGTLGGPVTNMGNVMPGHGGPSGALTMTGAYVGNGGQLTINTVLGGDASPTSQLVLSGPGASATGNTNVVVNNVGGAGG